MLVKDCILEACRYLGDKKAEEVVLKKEKEVEPQPEPQLVPQVACNDDIPDHVKVAIMAAIMAFYEQQNEKCEFTVRKIVRRR